MKRESLFRGKRVDNGEDEYIEREAVLAEYDRQHKGPPGGARKIIAEFPAADVVSRDCYNAILWENDVMRKQLAEIAKGFGQRMDDVRHVVHARWIELDECSNEGVYCSNCLKKVYKFSYSNTMKRKSNFCPNCGAKMDGGEDREMERLTMRDDRGEAYPLGDALSYQMIDKLCEYEDAEEQGLLVRLPCKVGDTVYRIWKVNGRESLISTHCFDSLPHIVEWLNKFGKTVFLTREEAEAALAKEG